MTATTAHDQVRTFTERMAPLFAVQRIFFNLRPGWAEYFSAAAVRAITAGEAPGDAPASPGPASPVGRRIAHYRTAEAAGGLDGLSMYAIAANWPAWDREHPGPVSAECGYTDYVDAAAIRTVTRGEAA